MSVRYRDKAAYSAALRECTLCGSLVHDGVIRHAASSFGAVRTFVCHNCVSQATAQRTAPNKEHAACTRLFDAAAPVVLFLPPLLLCLFHSVFPFVSIALVKLVLVSILMLLVSGIGLLCYGLVVNRRRGDCRFPTDKALRLVTYSAFTTVLYYSYLLIYG